MRVLRWMLIVTAVLIVGAAGTLFGGGSSGGGGVPEVPSQATSVPGVDPAGGAPTTSEELPSVVGEESQAVGSSKGAVEKGKAPPFFNESLVERIDATIQETEEELEEKLRLLEALSLGRRKIASEVLSGVVEAFLDGEDPYPVTLAGIAEVLALEKAIERTREEIAVLRRKIDVLESLRNSEIAKRGQQRFPR